MKSTHGEGFSGSVRQRHKQTQRKIGKRFDRVRFLKIMKV
jgi:hypothetical protein